MAKGKGVGVGVGVAQPARWLLLMPQVPSKPDYLRVKLSRRLSRLGAVAVRSSVYALPYTADAAEDFAWLRSEIVKDGGDAVVVAAKLLDGPDNEDIAELFRRDANRRYAEIAGEARAALGEDSVDAGAYHRLQRRLEAVIEIDYFGADGRDAAEDALRQLGAHNRGGEAMAAAAAELEVGTARTWVTRTGIKVDRIGSAWLIRRFIDPAAQFKFVDPNTYEHSKDELRFDMFEGEFTHAGNRCTFETLIARFGLQDKALAQLAEVVHDIDMKDAHYNRPETPGFAMLINGLVGAFAEDDDRLKRGVVFFDSLYDAFARTRS